MGVGEIYYFIFRSEYRRKYFDGATLRFIVIFNDEDALTRLESVEMLKSKSYKPIIFLIKNETGSFQPVYKQTLAASHLETLDLDKKESLNLFSSKGLKVESNNQ